MIRKLAAVLAVLAIPLLVFVALVVWSYGDVVSSVTVEEKLVALSYDDGPNPPYTADLLALLAAKGVRATFFPKGRNVDEFPVDARAIVAAGHEIGNHSYYHAPMTSL